MASMILHRPRGFEAMAFTFPRWYDDSWVLERIDAPDDPLWLTTVGRLSRQAVGLAIVRVEGMSSHRVGLPPRNTCRHWMFLPHRA